MITLHTKVGNRILDHEEGEFFQFSAGEWHINPKHNYFSGTEIALITGKVDANDFVKLQAWSQVVADDGGAAWAIIPYLPAGRMDRGIPCTGDIYSQMINRSGARVITFDAHSQATLDKYHDVINVTSDVLAGPFTGKYDGIIAPDAGAADRAKLWGDKLEAPVYTASKKRDFSSGKLIEFNTPEGMPKHGNFLIVDDICDGGGTFNGLAEVIKRDTYNTKLDLFVSHGIFSKGTAELMGRFHNVYTTDAFKTSYARLQSVQSIPIIDTLFKAV